MSIIVAALLVWKFGIGAFLSSVLAVTLHECFHAIAAKTRGYPSERIIFCPTARRFTTITISTKHPT